MPALLRHEDRLHKAQRAMSRKVKFSNNWKKAKACVQKIHSRIGKARRDFLTAWMRSAASVTTLAMTSSTT